jgi:hypothetical protein
MAYGMQYIIVSPGNAGAQERQMRTQMIECKSRKTAINAMPWAAKIVKVVGGYIGFESIRDFEIWKNQN